MLDAAAAADKAALTKTAADINRAWRSTICGAKSESTRRQCQRGIGALAHLLLLRPTVLLKPAVFQIVADHAGSADSNPDELVGIAFRAGRRFKKAKRCPPRRGTGCGNRGSRLVAALRYFVLRRHVWRRVNSQMNDFGARSDGEADVYWELHNLGRRRAQARLRETQLNETSYQLAEIRRSWRGSDGRLSASDRRPRKSEFRAQGVAAIAGNLAEVAGGSFGLGGQQHLFDPLEPLIAERD